MATYRLNGYLLIGKMRTVYTLCKALRMVQTHGSATGVPYLLSKYKYCYLKHLSYIFLKSVAYNIVTYKLIMPLIL